MANKLIGGKGPGEEVISAIDGSKLRLLHNKIGVCVPNQLARDFLGIDGNGLKGRLPIGYGDQSCVDNHRQMFSNILSKGGKPALVSGAEIAYEGSSQDGIALISISIGGKKQRDGLLCPAGITSEFDLKELGIMISVRPEEAMDSACFMTITSVSLPLMAP